MLTLPPGHGEAESEKVAVPETLPLVHVTDPGAPKR
jgi:hypothetical protein